MLIKTAPPLPVLGLLDLKKVPHKWATIVEIAACLGLPNSTSDLVQLGVRMHKLGHCKIGIKMAGKKVWAWCMTPGLPPVVDLPAIRAELTRG